jgi:mannose-6-phosphate isomerase class I
MIDNELFIQGIEITIHSPFRVVPFFDPAPWGGQWMKETCGLDRSKSNYGWCFDCVPEENSLLLEVSGELFEIPSNDLVFLRSKELLGEAVEGRFGVDFPIRFDLLDTIGGGNLSLQVHPTTQYIRDTFGVSYTQDESYYILATGQGGGDVFLGVKETTVPDEMIESLKAAEKGEIIFDTEKFVNKFHAEKHDHFLIPGGTIHCSGENTLVLEISATPNIFTFKLWDWARLGLDGKPRPINIEHGSNVINWKRDTSYVKQNLVNTIEKVAEGDGWHEERTGLHPAEFIETRRHWFEKTVLHSTHGSVNVLNLVEGDEILVESPTNKFKPFTVHFAETFIIPAHIDTYTITPSGKSKDLKCTTIKAFVKFKA